MVEVGAWVRILERFPGDPLAGRNAQVTEVGPGLVRLKLARPVVSARGDRQYVVSVRQRYVSPVVVQIVPGARAPT